MRRTCGNVVRTKSAVPSDEPLSTRIISAVTPDCARAARRQSSRYILPFQVTMTTDISGGTAIGIERQQRRTAPGEFRGSAQPGGAHPGTLLLVVHDVDDGIGPCRLIQGIEQQPRVSNNLRKDR